MNKDKEHFWRGVFESQQRSGNAIASFYGTRQIAVHQFNWWRRRLQRCHVSGKVDTPKAASFIPVRISWTADVVEKVHSDDFTIRPKPPLDAASLQQVLRALNMAPGGEP